MIDILIYILLLPRFPLIIKLHKIWLKTLPLVHRFATITKVITLIYSCTSIHIRKSYFIIIKSVLRQFYAISIVSLHILRSIMIHTLLALKAFFVVCAKSWFVAL
jgi:hypothetical protein